MRTGVSSLSFIMQVMEEDMSDKFELLSKMNLTIRGLIVNIEKINREIDSLYEELDINSDVKYAIRDIKQMEQELHEKKEYYKILLIKRDAWEQCRYILFERSSYKASNQTYMEALEALKRYDENYEAALLQHGENIVSEPVYENQKAIDQLESLIVCQFSKKELDYIRLKTLGYDSTLRYCIDMSAEEQDDLTSSIEQKLSQQEILIGDGSNEGL